MNKLSLLLFFSSCFTVLGQEALHSSTLTLGVGGLPYSDNHYYPRLQKGGPTFTGNYEYRFFKYLAVEGGTDILLPSGQSFLQFSSIPAGQNLLATTQGCTGCVVLIPGRSQVTLLTYGFKGILPLANDRLELFAGVGGAYAWNSEFRGLSNSAFAQVSLGGRFAVDRGHRFWLGTTARGFSSFGTERQAWIPVTFNLGIRFGHQ